MCNNSLIILCARLQQDIDCDRHSVQFVNCVILITLYINHSDDTVHLIQNYK